MVTWAAPDFTPPAPRTTTSYKETTERILEHGVRLKHLPTPQGPRQNAS